MRYTLSYDPVTRIEGHLKIALEIDTVAGVQQVVDARASGELYRGIEKVLTGRDVRDAQHITERICGVCPVAHGMAAVLAQDDAFATTIPLNAVLLRNLVNGSNFVESHVLHFYLLTLPDFIAGPAVPPWQADWALDRRFGQADSDALLQHYLAALTIRRKADQLTALLGGRAPHPPGYIGGGFTCTPRPERIAQFEALLDEILAFIEVVYIPDVQRLTATYPDYLTFGRGYGNLLAYGGFTQTAQGTDAFFARGLVRNGSDTVEALDLGRITEHVTFSWYQGREAWHPAGLDAQPQNPKSQAYSWLKAPRYDGMPCEVGPLARMWINGDVRGGISVMDRHVARAQEALKMALALRTWVRGLDPAGPVYAAPVPTQSVTGVGLTEAPRGSLGHWLAVGPDGRIARYEIIAPTTWNCCPRDNSGVLGPLEQALLGTPVQDRDRPIEVMRVIHSFDPCLDCSTH